MSSSRFLSYLSSFSLCVASCLNGHLKQFNSTMSIEYFLEKNCITFIIILLKYAYIAKENFLESADLPYFVDFRDQQQVPCVRVLCVSLYARCATLRPQKSPQKNEQFLTNPLTLLMIKGNVCEGKDTMVTPIHLPCPDTPYNSPFGTIFQAPDSSTHTHVVFDLSLGQTHAHAHYAQPSCFVALCSLRRRRRRA